MQLKIYCTLLKACAPQGLPVKDSWSFTSWLQCWIPYTCGNCQWLCLCGVFFFVSFRRVCCLANWWAHLRLLSQHCAQLNNSVGSPWHEHTPVTAEHKKVSKLSILQLWQKLSNETTIYPGRLFSNLYTGYTKW